MPRAERENRRATVGPHGQVTVAPSRKEGASGAQLKCLCVNTYNIGNKQGELEVCVQLQGYDLIAITETWWDSSHDWNMAMDVFVLFRKDRPGRQGGEVPFT